MCLAAQCAEEDGLEERHGKGQHRKEDGRGGHVPACPRATNVRVPGPLCSDREGIANRERRALDAGVAHVDAKEDASPALASSGIDMVMAISLVMQRRAFVI